jgi:hypothetical protein
MFYIFNSNDKIIGWCDYLPDIDDLNSRDEFWIESNDVIKDPRTLIVGKYRSLWEPAPSEKTEEQLLKDKTEKLLNERNVALSSTDWIVSRHMEQKVLNISTSLSDEDFNKYLVYRQELRDITSDINFPNVELPAIPQIIRG